MKRYMERLNLKDESGATVVIVALFMVVLLGFAALAIDGGRLYLEKSELQKALDAAVLAGAQGLRTGQAKSIAIDTAQKNDFTISESNLTVTNESIKATKEVSVPMTFAKVLGIESVNISAKAKAMSVPLKSSKRVTPIAVEKSQIPNGTNINCEKKKHSPGNCGFLAIGGRGANVLEDGIKNGVELSINTSSAEIDMEEETATDGSNVKDKKDMDNGSGTTVETEPGMKWGKVRSAFDYLFAQDKDKLYCQKADTADTSCRRVIFVPIIPSWEGTNGRDVVEVIGIAAYWVEEVTNKKVIKGKFLRIVTAGELLDSNETIDPDLGEYNLHGVRLVD